LINNRKGVETCIGGKILKIKSGAGAEIKGSCPELYALPGGTGMAARCHTRRLEIFISARATKRSG